MSGLTQPATIVIDSMSPHGCADSDSGSSTPTPKSPRKSGVNDSAAAMPSAATSVR
jgi:hypothetical protein